MEHQQNPHGEPIEAFARGVKNYLDRVGGAPTSGRIVGVDRLTALVLEARVAIEACTLDASEWSGPAPKHMLNLAYGLNIR